jgi:hypothetical protein
MIVTRLSLRTRRNKLTAAGAALLLIAGAGVAYAYWSGLGGGATDGANAPGSVAMTITSNKVDGLTPGGSIALAGSVVNPPSGTAAMAGNVLGTITAVGGPAGSIADYWISGIAKVNANVPAGQSVAWSGLTLHYANSANDQNSGKGAGINISYSLTAPGIIIGEGSMGGADQGQENGSCASGTPGDSGPVWAQSTFDKQFQLVKDSGGYAMTVVYGNGTFTGIAGATAPGACDTTQTPTGVGDGTKVGTGVTGTMSGVWTAQINTPLIGNPLPDCSNHACDHASGFLTAVFGNSSMQPSMAGYSWTDTFNAGPLHGSWIDTAALGVVSDTNAGNIK